jgi:thioredoxin 1
VQNAGPGPRRNCRRKGDAVKVVKVNVDEEPDLAVEYGIRNIPALFFFKDGELKDKALGVQPKSEIIKRLLALA